MLSIGVEVIDKYCLSAVNVNSQGRPVPNRESNGAHHANIYWSQSGIYGIKRAGLPFHFVYTEWT